MGLLKEMMKTNDYNSVVSDRDKYIGGSDIGQIKDIASAIRVVRDKLSPQREFKSIYTEFGNIAEPLIRFQLGQMWYGGEYIAEPKNNIIVNREEGLAFRGNIDGYDERAKAVIEIKTLGEKYIKNKVEYRKKVEAYKSQNGFYQKLVGYKRGVIAVLPRPEWLIDKAFDEWTFSEMIERKVEIETFIVQELIERLTIIDCNLDDKLDSEVERRIALFDKAYKQVYNAKPDEDETIQDLLEEYVELTKDKETIEERIEEIKTLFAENYNDVQIWETALGQITFTPAKTSVRKSFDSKAFAKDNPIMYQRYIKESTTNYKPTLKLKG